MLITNSIFYNVHLAFYWVCIADFNAFISNCRQLSLNPALYQLPFHTRIFVSSNQSFLDWKHNRDMTFKFTIFCKGISFTRIFGVSLILNPQAMADTSPFPIPAPFIIECFLRLSLWSRFLNSTLFINIGCDSTRVLGSPTKMGIPLIPWNWPQGLPEFLCQI